MGRSNRLGQMLAKVAKITTSHDALTSLEDKRKLQATLQNELKQLQKQMVVSVNKDTSELSLQLSDVKNKLEALDHAITETEQTYHYLLDQEKTKAAIDYIPVLVERENERIATWQQIKELEAQVKTLKQRFRGLRSENSADASRLFGAATAHKLQHGKDVQDLYDACDEINNAEVKALVFNTVNSTHNDLKREMRAGYNVSWSQDAKVKALADVAAQEKGNFKVSGEGLTQWG